MPIQKVFKRYEMKYLLNPQQKEKMLQAMEPYMSLDQYGRTTIRNLYFDTDTYRLVRHSIEKPAYKEKLRIRSYSQSRPDSTVFVELKKKYKKMLAQMAERDFQMRCYMMKYMQYNTDQMKQLSDSFSYYVTPVQQVQQSPQRSQWMEQVDKWLPQVVGIVLTGITTYFAKKKESTWHK